MGRHLKIETWFDHTSTGTLRKKRVSEKANQQFPRVYRELYQHCGIAALIRNIRTDYDCGLAEAWERVKGMFNTKVQG